MTIYFDMDGVLADFDRGIAEFCGLEPIPQDRSTPEEHDRMLAAMRDVEHFYGRLEPLEEGIALFREVYAECGDTCQILTGIPRPARGITSADQDKREWVKRIISPEVKVNVVLRKEKPQYCTGPEDILIDDYIANIRAWEKSGGTGILYKNAEQTKAELRRMGILK